MLTNKLENLKGPMLFLCLFTLAGLKERMGILPHQSSSTVLFSSVYEGSLVTTMFAEQAGGVLGVFLFFFLTIH
ncbi:hypothetical protein LguiA_022180 [Lonicera macranthoides]